MGLQVKGIREEAVEAVWHVTDGETEFRLQVLLKTVHQSNLYRPDPPLDGGVHIDVGAHVARANDGGVLTTGANSTHAMPGRYVALGRTAISVGIGTWVS